jgi:DNA-binding response OmpR family regulator
MRRGALAGQTILIVEEEPVIALDVRMALEGAGATAVRATAHDAVTAIEERTFAAAVLDLRPGSNDHRPIARKLRKRSVPFLFYSTHEPEVVTTVRGAPVILKSAPSDDVVKATALLLS